MPNKRFVYLGLPIFTAQSIYNFSVNHKPNSVQKAKKYERNQTKPIKGPMPPPVDDGDLGLAPRQGVCLGVCVCKLVRHRWRHQSWQTRLPWWRRPSSGNSWINSNNNNENINRVTGKQDEGERASTAGQLCVREAHKALNTVSSTLFHWIQLKGEIENWNSIKML